MVPASKSETVYGASSRSKASRTSARFIRTAATYQTAISTRTIVTTGAKRSTSGCCRKRPLRSAGKASVLLVIGMPCPKADPNPLRNLQEFRRLTNFQRAVARKIAVDDIDDAAGSRRHHHDLGGQEHRLGNRVGHEQDGLSGLVPQLQQLLI